MNTETSLNKKKAMDGNLPFYSEITRVYKTSDYSIFTFLVGNRKKEDCTKHIQHLKKLILENGWDRSSILVVNKHGVLMDGQNRLWALKEIQEETGRVYEIRYDVNDNYTLRDVILGNSSRLSWNPKNYIHSYADQGNSDYKFIVDLMNQFKFPPSTITTLLNQTYNNVALKEGKLKVDDRERVFQYCIDIEKIKPYFEFYNTKNFISAMMFYLSKDEFNIDEFINKLKQNRNMLYRVTTVADYKMLIQTLYNYRRQGKITFIKA